LAERSLVYAEDGKYDLAVADADKAVALVSDHYTLGNRCWIRAVAGKALDAASEDCNKALAEHKDAPTADALALVDYKRGDFKAALDNYNAALDLFPHQWSSLYMRGIVKTRTGDASGKADIDEAMSHAPFIADEFAGYGVKP
jgi:tetratricopeptide (TPR) repeat protein